MGQEGLCRRHCNPLNQTLRVGVLAGRRLPGASSQRCVLWSWREDGFLPFVYFRRGLGLGLGPARSGLGLQGLLAEHKATWQELAVGTRAWCPGGCSQACRLFPPRVFFVSGPVGGAQGAVLGWQHPDNPKPSLLSQGPRWWGSSHSRP